jgi:hypothetical protein
MTPYAFGLYSEGVAQARQFMVTVERRFTMALAWNTAYLTRVKPSAFPSFAKWNGDEDDAARAKRGEDDRRRQVATQMRSAFLKFSPPRKASEARD